MPLQPSHGDSQHQGGQADYYGNVGNRNDERLALILRMGVRLALVPLLLVGVPAVARATFVVVMSFIIAFAVTLPFMVALAAMTWRKLVHPVPARRSEPRRRRAVTLKDGEEEDMFTSDSTRSCGSKEEKSRLPKRGIEDDADQDVRAIRKVAVIGGGAAGLATLRQMLKQGMDAVLFERSDDIGGLWNYDNKDTSKVFNSVTQNVTKLHNRFSGYPAPSHWPLYLGHRHTLEYLKGYAALFGLMPHVRLRHEVISCECDAEGKFELQVVNTETSKAAPRPCHIGTCI